MNWPGGTAFATEQLQDDNGRNIIWIWISQPPKPAHLRNYGWSGIMSLPRNVSLARSGIVQIDPAPELNAIRTQELRERPIELRPNQEVSLQAKGKSLELDVELAGGRTSPFGLKVFASPDGREETVIRYEPAKGELVVDFVKSSMGGPVSLPPFIFDPVFMNPTMKDQIKPLLARFPKQVSEQRAPLMLAQGEPLKLNVFLDRSVMEVFANGRQVVTQVVYPALQASTGVKVFSGNEPVTMKAGQSWKMAETNAY
jgi:beta-fructofuranosidase